MAKVNIAAELTALPLGQMLSGPLTAAIEAQAMSAISTAEFINTVGFKEGFGGKREAVMLDFTFNSNVVDPNTGEAQNKTTELSVPLLAIVEAPHMAITDLSVSFEFKIHDVVSKSNQLKVTSGLNVETTYNTETSVGAQVGLPQYMTGGSANASTSSTFKMNMNVSATYQRATRHDTDRSATLKMTMNAEQRVPEGFRRVLAILHDAITAQVDTVNVPAPTPPGP